MKKHYSKFTLLFTITFFLVANAHSQRHRRNFNQIGDERTVFLEKDTIYYSSFPLLTADENKTVLDSISSWFPQHTVLNAESSTIDLEGFPIFSLFTLNILNSYTGDIRFEVVMYTSLNKPNASLSTGESKSLVHNGYTPAEVLVYLPIDIDDRTFARKSLLTRVLLNYKAISLTSSEEFNWIVKRRKHSGLSPNAKDILMRNTLLISEEDISLKTSYKKLKRVYPYEIQIVNAAVYYDLIDKRSEGYVCLERVKWNMPSGDLCSFSIIELSTGNPVMGIWGWDPGSSGFKESRINSIFFKKINRTSRRLTGKSLF